MLKSSRLVIISGLLLGLSVTLLPLSSYAVADTNTVRAVVDGILSLTATAHTGSVQDSDYTATYDSTNNIYAQTFAVGSASTTFGKTSYEVVCNFLSTTTIKDEGGTNNANCANGWKVNATADHYDSTSHAATMTQTGVTSAISSIKANGWTGTTSNWGLRVSPTGTHAPIAASYTDSVNSLSMNYATMEALPRSNASAQYVVYGDTFSESAGVYTYLGPQTFDVVYGVSVGPEIPAGTYSGTITYTLVVKAPV